MAKINYDGTNIVGGPFKPYVDEQIKVRQEKLGNFNKTSEEIVWENGKSAFVALASSVNIANSKISEYIDTTGGEEANISSGEDTTDLSGYNGLTNQLVNYVLSDGITGKTLVTTENNDGEERVKLLDLAGDPQQYFGNFLARNIVLYGGTSYFTPDSDGFLTGPNYRFGITEKNNVFDDSAYGFGGTNPDGFKPMPGITSFNLKSKNMGSLRDASITIRANSEEQFKMIDNLYCRIGYTMFLEWGNSLYFDNEGKYKRDGTSSMIPMFLSGKTFEDGAEVDLTKDPNSFISRIEARREESNGNYDAFFGRVKNFSWEYIAKGGYWEISLSLISWGDVIESLTIDGQYGTLEERLENELLGTQPHNTSALTRFLDIVATPAGTNIRIVNKEGEITRTNFIQDNDDLFKNYLQSTTKITQKDGYFSPPGETETIKPGDTIASLSYTRLPSSRGKIASAFAQFGTHNYYYIRFGDILDFIKDRLLLYISTSSKPIIDIDTDTLKNICYYPGINVSADPSKVMVNNPIPYGFGLEDLTYKNLEYDSSGNAVAPIGEEKDWEFPIIQDSIFRLPKAQLENFGSKFNPNDPKEDFPLHGKIMNIYFEYQYLIDTIEELRNEDTTKIPLYDFVDKLLKTANSCLGGVNKLSIRLEDDRIMRIYDQNSIYGTQVPDNEGSTVNLYGMKPLTDLSGSMVGTEGSFVTEVNIKTELTNDFSTTVSVGAQAQGKTVGEDATGLSRWNFGLVDRYYPQKLDSLSKDNNEDKPTIQEKIETLKQQLKFLWFGYSQGYTEELNVNPGLDGTKIKKYYFKDFPTDRYSEFVKLQKDWLAELIKLENELANAESQSKGISRFGTNQIGMIPINIQVTMDGLSGIRIYDRLKVDTRFLPNYYPQTLYWIIKGVSHEVINNKWNTKLETIAVPKLPESQNLERLVQSSNSGNSNDLLDSTTNQYEPAQSIFSTPTTLSSFAASVNSSLGSNYNDSIKASVVFLAQQEQNLQGFNYNYYGVQTDLKWSGIEPYINGSFNSKEGEAGQGDRTANARWFASFKTEEDGIKFVAGKLNSKGWGNIENDRTSNSQAAAEKYYGSWLFGNPNSPKVQELLEKDANKGNKKQELWDASLEAIKTYSTPIENDATVDEFNSTSPNSTPEFSQNTDVRVNTGDPDIDNNNNIPLPRYIRNGVDFTKEEWINLVNQATQEELNTGQWRVENDDTTFQILINKLQS